MLTLESLRRIDPSNTADLTNEELSSIRDSFYDLGQLIFEDWQQNELSSKYPTGSLTESDKSNTI